MSANEQYPIKIEQSRICNLATKIRKAVDEIYDRNFSTPSWRKHKIELAIIEILKSHA